MYEQVENPKENKSRAVANSVAQKKSNGKQGFGFVDNRHESITQRKLQEMANRSQVNQVVQLQPSNFYRSYNLPMYQDKFDGFKGERSGLIAKPLNALKSKNIINSRKFIGGHLLKAEFGGEDVRDNVVPWTDSAESRFSHYEDTYKSRITQHYQNLVEHSPEALDNGKWGWTFHLAVQYKDRDESDFPIAIGHGYSAQERKAIYDELSEIPVSVMVNPGNTSDYYSIEGDAISGDIRVNVKPDAADVQGVIAPQKQAPDLDLSNIVDHYLGRFSNNLDLLIRRKKYWTAIDFDLC